MLLVKYEIIDGCNWDRPQVYREKFADKNELDQYIDRMAAAMYEINILNITEE